MNTLFTDSNLYDGAHAYVARYGGALLEWLDARPGEHVLDLGCGTGDLTAQIAATGAHVAGADVSPDMIAAARQKFPALPFFEAEATAIPMPERPYDAVFSNAVLHWIPDLKPVASCLARILRPGGRFIAEFGGIHCCDAIYGALEAELTRRGHPVRRPCHFRPLSRIAADFEAGGLRIERAHWFRRDTPLQGPDGLRNFLRMFCHAYVDDLPAAEQDAIFACTVETLRPQLLRPDGWHADYTRQRILAVRP